MRVYDNINIIKPRKPWITKSLRNRDYETLIVRVLGGMSYMGSHEVGMWNAQDVHP